MGQASDQVLFPDGVLLDPQLFVVGGGVSRVSEKFLPYIDIKTPIVAAKLHNEAGIIGAAYYASTKQK